MENITNSKISLKNEFGDVVKLPVKLTGSYGKGALSKAKQIKILESLLVEWNVSKACGKVGIDRNKMMRFMAESEHFRNAVDLVEEYHLDTSEAVIYAEAQTGKKLLANIFQLKNRRVKKWGDKVNVNNETTVTHKIEIAKADREVLGLLGRMNREINQPGYKELPQSIPFEEVKPAK